MLGIRNVLWLSATQIFPAYSTHQAVKNRDQREALRWVKYWICYSLLLCLDELFGWVINWLPMYNTLLYAIVIWMQIPAFGGASFLYDACVAHRFDAAHIVALELIGAALEKARLWICDFALNFGENFLRTFQERAMQNSNGLFLVLAFNNLISRLRVTNFAGNIKETANTNNAETQRPYDTNRNQFSLGAASKLTSYESGDSENEMDFNCGSGNGDGDSAEWQTVHGNSVATNVQNITLTKSPSNAANQSGYLERLVSPVSSALRNAFESITSRASPSRSAVRRTANHQSEIVNSTVNDAAAGPILITDFCDSSLSMVEAKRKRGRARNSRTSLVPDVIPSMSISELTIDDHRHGGDEFGQAIMHPEVVPNETNVAESSKSKKIPKAPVSSRAAAARPSRRSKVAKAEDVLIEGDNEVSSGNQRSRSGSRSRIPRTLK